MNLSGYKDSISKYQKLKLLTWSVVWSIFARSFPRSFGRKWKIFLLRMFGANIHITSNIYSSVRIYAPWNLVMKEYSSLGPEVDCYNVDKIIIGANTSISQKCYLCSASHDFSDVRHPLITKPIIIHDQVWIGAAAFIGMGVTIGQGAVVGATASVYKDVEPWTVVGGNPAKFIKKREINE
jgi:putative colanic acid biosynthesis acetyltransferase WcaF